MQDEKRKAGRPKQDKVKRHITVRIDEDLYNKIIQKFGKISSGIDHILSKYFNKSKKNK